MAMTVVNARVDSAVKRRVASVLARRGQTTSDLIRAVYDQIDQTGTLPEYLADSQAAAAAARRAKLDKLLPFAGIIHSEPPLSDADVDRIIFEETVRRHA